MRAARPGSATIRKVTLLITDKDLRDFSRGYLVVGRKGDDSGAMVGFARKHRTSVACARPDALRRFVEANVLEFYTTTTYFRRVETVISLDLWSRR